jgi:hypothetical protein
MVEDTPVTRPSGQDPEEAWLAALAGRRAPGAPPAPGSGEDLAIRSGELIRARFAKALSAVRAAPDPELTRVRILTAAAAGRPAQPRQPRALAFAGAGLAAGIVGTLLLQPHAPRDFADVESSSEYVRSIQMRAASDQPARSFTVISTDVKATAGQLAAILARAGVTFQMTAQEHGVLFELQALNKVPQPLIEAAARLKIEFPPHTAIQVSILEHRAQ